MPVDNGSSLNTLIRIKNIALAYIIAIETSVLALYLLMYYLIFKLPLLCTSSWRFEISCLPSIYFLIEFSSKNQIQPKLSVLVKSTYIYIFSIEQIDIYGGSIRYIPIVIVMVMGDNFRFQFLIIRIFVVAILKLDQALFLCYSKKNRAVGIGDAIIFKFFFFFDIL